MTPALNRLIALARVTIDGATAALEAGGSVRQWERAMERAITTAHTAAYIAAAAERLGVSPDSPLISRQRLSRAERADIDKAVADQVAYLQKFAGQLDGLTPGQIAARARMYGSSITPFYYTQRYGPWDIPARLLPGNQTCLTNCRCSVEIRDNGDGTGVLVRTLGPTEQSCDECVRLAGRHPIRRKTEERRAA